MKRRGSSRPPDDLAAFAADQYDRVRGALTLFTGDRRLAEELAQEAFVKVCQHWERVQTMDAPGAWVHRVAINLALSRARRRRTEARVADRTRHDRVAHAPAADEALGDEALRRAVAALPAEERAALVLRFYADLSVAEVAVALAVPEGTVKTRTRRALATLRSDEVLSEAEVAGISAGPDGVALAVGADDERSDR